MASVTKRLAFYGNTEDLNKQVEDLSILYGADFKFDKDMFVTMDPKKTENVSYGGELRLRDMSELHD